MADPQDRFKIGAGRPRPAHEPKEVACASCGAGVELKDERAQVFVCGYCHTEISLADKEAVAIGAVGEAPDGFQLEIGAPFLWRSVRYEVVGRTLRNELEDPSSYSYGYYLYNRAHPSLWLSCYNKQWTLGRRTRVLPKGDPWTLTEGDTLSCHDGSTWVFDEENTSELLYVDGSLPWLAKVGDLTHHVELSEPAGGNAIFEVEKITTGEIEQSQGTRLTPAELKAATAGELGAGDAVDYALLEKYGESPRLRAIGITWTIFGVVALLTAAYFSFSATPVFTQSIPAAGGEVGPLTVDKANSVYEIELRQSFRKDGWSYVEAEVLDEDENYLFGFGDELWAESGYDEGPWHEEKNVYTLDVTIPEAGNFYLGFVSEVGAANGAAAQAEDVGGDVHVTVYRRKGSALPFWVAGLFALIGGILTWEVATGRIREKLSEMSFDS